MRVWSGHVTVNFGLYKQTTLLHCLPKELRCTGTQCTLKYLKVSNQRYYWPMVETSLKIATKKTSFGLELHDKSQQNQKINSFQTI